MQPLCMYLHDFSEKLGASTFFEVFQMIKHINEQILRNMFE